MNTPLMSANEISRRTGHAAPSIYEALERLKIKPSLITANGFRYYREDVIEKLRAAMRQPSRKS